MVNIYHQYFQHILSYSINNIFMINILDNNYYIIYYMYLLQYLAYIHMDMLNIYLDLFVSKLYNYLIYYMIDMYLMQLGNCQDNIMYMVDYLGCSYMLGSYLGIFYMCSNCCLGLILNLGNILCIREDYMMNIIDIMDYNKQVDIY